MTALTRVTITGADDEVAPEELRALSAEFPFVEWALLYSPARVGTPRYPTQEWLLRFLEECPGVTRAIHLCGDAVRQFAQGMPTLQDLVQQFHRVQLNFNQTKVPQDLGALRGSVVATPGITFITQYNKANLGVAEALGGVRNHALLFDGSGGRGVSPPAWRAPIEGFACGYAGGLNPGNLGAQLVAIGAAAGGHPFWVDMESGVRTHLNRFDPGAVRRCLEIAKPYCARRATPEFVRGAR